MALPKDWQEKDEHIHYCRRCGIVAEIIPQDNEGHHLNCHGPIGSLVSVTKERYTAMSDIEKQSVYQEVAKINGQLREALNKVSVENLASRPHCPMCKSTNFSKITTTSRMASIFAFGLASSSIGKQYKCNKCGHKW